jgi:hypothetical protein
MSISIEVSEGLAFQIADDYPQCVACDAYVQHGDEATAGVLGDRVCCDDECLRDALDEYWEEYHSKTHSDEVDLDDCEDCQERRG